jgi:hypothetical protein
MNAIVKSNSFFFMLKKYFQLLPLEYCTVITWQLIYCDMLDLWLMPQLLQNKPNVFQHDRVQPHIHSEVTTFLNRQLPELWSAEGFVIPGLFDLQIWSPMIFTVGHCERWGLRSDTAYNPEQPEGLTVNSDCRKYNQCLFQNVWHKVE